MARGWMRAPPRDCGTCGHRYRDANERSFGYVLCSPHRSPAPVALESDLTFSMDPSSSGGRLALLFPR